MRGRPGCERRGRTHRVLAREPGDRGSSLFHVEQRCRDGGAPVLECRVEARTGPGRRSSPKARQREPEMRGRCLFHVEQRGEAGRPPPLHPPLPGSRGLREKWMRGGCVDRSPVPRGTAAVGPAVDVRRSVGPARRMAVPRGTARPEGGRATVESRREAELGNGGRHGCHVVSRTPAGRPMTATRVLSVFKWSTSGARSMLGTDSAGQSVGCSTWNTAGMGLRVWGALSRRGPGGLFHVEHGCGGRVSARGGRQGKSRG
jgi:hypothetical protein